MFVTTETEGSAHLNGKYAYLPRFFSVILVISYHGMFVKLKVRLNWEGAAYKKSRLLPAVIKARDVYPRCTFVCLPWPHLIIMPEASTYTPF